MSEDVDTYCRLCAEPTPVEQMIKEDDDVAISSKIETKMLWINVDVSNNDELPKTICFSCFDLLEKTWHFLYEVRMAHQKLVSIYGKKVTSEADVKVPVVENVGKPVDESWEDFQVLKSEVKVENFEISMDKITAIDSNCLIKAIKRENNDDYNDLSNGFNTDSDEPLLKVVSWKHKKSKKKKRKICLKEVNASDLLPDSDAEGISLDMSLFMSWEVYTWQCANCDAQCKSVELLRLHSLEIHSSCCVFKCSDCNRSVTNFQSFVNHVRKHYKHLRYCCEFCSENFSIMQQLKRHKVNMHQNECINSCPNCGTFFSTAEELNDHILRYAKGVRRKHRKIKEEKLERGLKCDRCDKEFKSISNLRAHKLVHTERAREFSCHICGKMFFTKGSLRTHMSVHESSKPYICEFCEMAFKARGNLISHLSLHSGAKPFICEQCGKSFRVKRHLKSHSIVHTDLMPYSCEYCKKQFRFKTRLNLHLRQHTGSRPYSCIYCQRNFTNGSNYKKHMRRRHNIDTSKKKFLSVLPTTSDAITSDLLTENDNQNVDISINLT